MLPIFPFVQRAARKPVNCGIGRLDRNHPQLRGFTHFFAMTDPQHYGTGLVENFINSYNRKKTYSAIGFGTTECGWTADYMQVNITNNDAGIQTEADMCDSLTALTVIAEVRWKGSGNSEDNILTYWGNNNAEKKTIYRYDPSADQMEFFMRDSEGGSANYSLDVSGTTFSAGDEFFTVAARWNRDGAGSMEAWCGWDTTGVHWDTVTGTTSTTTSDNYGFFTQGSSAADEGQYDVRYCAFAPVAIPDAQLKAWFTNPWRPFRRPMPFFLQSSGATTFNESISLGASLNKSDTSQLNALASLALNSQHDITPAEQTQFLAAMTLAATLDITNNKELVMQLATTLGLQNNIVADVILSVESALQLNTQLSLTDVSEMIAETQASYGLQAGVSADAIATLFGAVSVGATFAKTADAGLAMEVAAALNVQENIATDVLVTIEDSIALGATLDETTQTIATFAAASTLANQLNITNAPIATYAAALSLLNNLGITTASALQEINVAMSLALQVTEANAAQATLEPATILALQQAINNAASAVFDEVITLDATLAASTLGGTVLSGLFSLGLSLDQSTTASIALDGAITLPVNAIYNASAQAEFNPSVQYGVALVEQALRTAIMQSNVSIDLQTDITMEGATFTLTIPPGTVFKVEADLRRFTVSAPGAFVPSRDNKPKP